MGDQESTDQNRAGTSKLSWLFRLAFLFVILGGIATAVFMLYGRWQALVQSGREFIEQVDPNLSQVERVYLQTYLSSREVELQQPVGTGTEPVIFVVSLGETADQIATNLAAAGMLADTELFINYVRYYGFDSELEAGEFTLSPQLTLPQLAQTLTRAVAQDVELRFLEGWRWQEMAGSLAVTAPANIDADAFRAIVQRQSAFDLSRYDFLASLPPHASLEGFLFPDTYRVPQDADAAYLVDEMLQNFGRRVTPAMRQSFGTHGLSLRQAVTLASIVEREAVLAGERPLIASVFYNRLAQGMKLEADPTTQYALGYQPDSGSWWKSPLYLTDLKLDSPYNTYVIEGLPPGPIANPSLSSLQAVADPADSNYLFFVADCTADKVGAHKFSMTYEEHLTNVERCR